MARSLFILGPTTSGKTTLSVLLAEDLQGEVINADSKQIYREIPIISAQPTIEEQKGIPHHLFAHHSVTELFTVVNWMDEAVPVMEAIQQRKKLPIFVGGTGLYLKALTEGLAATPPISNKVKKKVEQIHKVGGQALYEELNKVDPTHAQTLSPNDTIRNKRALEVFLETRKSISYFQKQVHTPKVPREEICVITLMPPREILYDRVNKRFDQMMAMGLEAEIQALLPLELRGKLPARLAHGVPELLDYLQGKRTKEEAIAKGKLNTRHYVKRQLTWIRHQLEADIYCENIMSKRGTVYRQLLEQIKTSL